MRKRPRGPLKVPDETPTCQYCGSAAICVPSTHVYGRDYGGWLWICAKWPACDAYVGCHKGTKLPLGILADPKLRAAKMRVHAAFDPIWRSGRVSRNDAYSELAAKMGIDKAACHVGMFSIAECEIALTVIDSIKQR